jgi:fructose-1,6-bisphosphatase/inositol monophosphatase family enzyme
MLDYLNAVSDLLKIAGATSIMPVFRSLEANPREKTPGEWVTTADNATEEYLTSELLSLLPGSVVIGEEAASSDSTVIEKLIQAENVWLVDPLDGTANFAAGVEPFACMVALIKNGEIVTSQCFGELCLGIMLQVYLYLKKLEELHRDSMGIDTCRGIATEMVC